MNIEYEASKSFELQNVIIHIPLPALRDVPMVNQVDGEWRLVLPNLGRNYVLQLWRRRAKVSCFVTISEHTKALLCPCLGMTPETQCWSGPSH